MEISLFAGPTDNDPQPWAGSWAELSELLSEHEVREAKSGPLWSPAAFSGTRCAENVREICALVLDFDHQADLGAIPDGNQGLAHSTWSDDPGADGRPPSRAYRVVLPYSRPISRSEHDRIWLLVRQVYPQRDPHCSDPCRMFFVPSCPPTGQPWVKTLDGPPLDVEQLLRAAPAGPVSASVATVPAATVPTATVPAATVPAGPVAVTPGQFLRLCKSVARSDSPLAEAFDALAKGTQYAQEGSRDDTLFRVCYVVAKKWPLADPAALSRYFETSVSATGGPTLRDVAYKLARAQAAVLEEKASKPDFDLGADDRPKTTVRNLVLGVAALQEGLYLDTFHDRECYQDGRQVADVDYVRMAVLLDERFGLQTSPQSLPGPTSLVAARTTRHPVVDWLRSLRWDGTPRLATWLADTGARDEGQLGLVGPWFVMQAVARVLGPAKADCALVLEGPGGIGKSTLLRRLFDPLDAGWFSDDLAGLGSKEAAERLVGKWLVELAELATLRRADNETLKAFITRREDTFRPAYGIKAKDFRRQCVFAGTTNDYVYLTDQTGGRRFWPVRYTGRIAFPDDPGALFAEAVARVDEGERYWPTADEEDLLARVVRDRVVSDSWSDALEDWLGSAYQGGPVTARYLLTNVLLVDRSTRADDIRLAQACQSVGMTRHGGQWHPNRPAAKKGLTAVG